MELPIAIFGLVKGYLRREAPGGVEVFLNNKGWNWLFMAQPVLLKPNNQNDPLPFAVTHLQKASKFGFLFMWPLCFHAWFTFRYQQRVLEEGKPPLWVPNSEKVLYWRVGLARWDAHDMKYIRPTWYGPGLHWD